MPARISPSTAEAGGHAGTGIRLRWWTLALPVLAFVALMGLLADPAQAGEAGEVSIVGILVEYLRHLLT
ncbi:hypothetical protein [Streptomyces yaizuensis]|uniref:Uncharacterized protein n=1 Tax=Streptomyces yaizuensis TaxID=2989713 RepID=A0ABQ5P805_9ACTN|nr:hypothetical protein [Streptomyces sp. YSPA8]GLF98717.1 hypothetical protein SYYSPA8_30490 [Streptomyces sp. YSPA8]